MRTFIAGTRGSALALWQTRHVAQALQATVEERVISTRGDRDASARLVGKLEKGFFTAELEEALRKGEIDWAVHSLKDLPTRQPEGLVLGAILRRAEAADLLLVREPGSGLLPLRAGAKVGSSSLRREALLKQFAPQCVAVPLRGNVPTRVEKLRRGEYDAIVVAHAGIWRLALDLNSLHAYVLNVRRWVCAPGQGAIAVQCRESDPETRALLSTLNHVETARAVTLEREFLTQLEGGCTTPFGCYVEGAQAWLGLAIENGFKTYTVQIPPSTQPEWLQRQLDLLSAQKELPNDEWLARRV